MEKTYDICIHIYSWRKVAEAYNLPTAKIIARALAKMNSNEDEYGVFDQSGNIIFKTKYSEGGRIEVQ